MDVEMKFTLPGILLMIFCFPLGILCAYSMRERKCRRCESPRPSLFRAQVEPGTGLTVLQVGVHYIRELSPGNCGRDCLSVDWNLHGEFPICREM